MNITRNFCHAKPKPRLPVRNMFAHGASGDDAILCHWAQNVSVRMCWNGNLPLIKHNCTSGRTHVSKRGVSLDAPDSYQRHTRVDSSGRGHCPWTLSSSNSMLYIRYITLVWYLWCDILHCYCDLLKLIDYVLYESKCAFNYYINVFTLPGFT